ncbi:MAG: SPOR domain-containing protein [Pseudomonadota bacterium]
MATMFLVACDENGEFAFPGSGSESAQTDRPTRSIQTNPEGRDVERPDIFEVNDRGLWDGRPSLGGVWVAHPDVQDPERVIIRNTENGRSVVGALFRRERENPGPLLQVSSDAAEELDILAGAPTDLSVVVLRREEVEEEAPAEPEVNPVVAALDAPVAVEAAPLDDPIAGAAAAIDAAEDAGEQAAEAATGAGAAAVAVALPAPADDAEEPAADNPVSEAAVALPTLDAAGEADLSGPQIQIGVFSVQANADDAAARLRAAGVPASVQVEQAGGRDVWRVVASPAGEDGDAEATIVRIKASGFVDAFVVDGEES